VERRAPRTEVRIQRYSHAPLRDEEAGDKPPYFGQHLHGEDSLRHEDESPQFDDVCISQCRHYDGRSRDGARDRREGPEDVHGELLSVKRELSEGVVLRELQLQPGGKK
jgi:hypothetical protein